MEGVADVWMLPSVWERVTGRMTCGGGSNLLNVRELGRKCLEG